MIRSAKMTFTGKRDGRKFNRIRGGYCVLAVAKKIAKVISYRNRQDGKISISCLVDNGKPQERNWQMVRSVLVTNQIGVVSKSDAQKLAEVLKQVSSQKRA